MLLDDELPGLTFLKIICEQIPELEVVKAYNDPDVFLSELTNLDFDLCIMDIEMPKLNGIELARMLTGKQVIFATAYKEYAADAFDLDAVDFVTKPIKLERLQKAVQKAIKRTNNTQSPGKFIQLNTNKGKTLLYYDKICFIKSSMIDSRDKNVLLRDGVKIVLKNISFEKLQELLPQNKFCRVNKQELIAVNIVQFFSHDQITSNIIDEPGKRMVFILTEVFRKSFLEKVSI